MAEVAADPGMAAVLAVLAADNPTVGRVGLQVYADALRLYLHAAAQVSKQGAICAHPRTGAPIENPYLKVQAAAGAILSKARRVRGDAALAVAREVWAAGA